MDQVFAWIANRKYQLTLSLAQAAFDQRQTDVDEIRGAIKDYEYMEAELRKLVATTEEGISDAPLRPDSL